MREAPVTTPSTPSDTAAALAAVLFSQQQWQLRKVERRHLREGSYSVASVSIDCVPQALPELRYQLAHEAADRGGQVLVPITMMRKGALRGFDMRDDSGCAVPVIGRSEYRELMVALLMHELGDAALAERTELLADALAAVVDGDVEAASHTAVDLVVEGTYLETRCVDASELSTYAAQLILRLADSYVLIALLPEERAGRRQVVKYEHHSHDQYAGLPLKRRRSTLGRLQSFLYERLSGGPVLRFRLAAGLEPATYEFELSHPAGSASHHFEVLIPDKLICTRLTMPGTSGRPDRNTTDITPDGVAHAVATYTEDPDDGAMVEFRVPLKGLRMNAALVCGVTSIMLLLGLLLPGAQQALLDASDGAAALLLAVPAVAFAFAVGEREPDMVALLLQPLRVVIVGCALLLLACAGSIVGVLHDWARYPLWWLGAIMTALTCATLLWTTIRVVVGRVRHHGG
ncbi:hypothetical protein [Cellulomonas iranensis]|nr:hypothetical protein [Cellulomonas iranensis]